MHKVSFPTQKANWENVIVLKLFKKNSLSLITMYLNKKKKPSHENKQKHTLKTP